jgi:hypothetical protein
VLYLLNNTSSLPFCSNLKLGILYRVVYVSVFYAWEKKACTIFFF